MGSAFVIGRTGFLGRHTVENLVDHGYQVTSLSRGSPGFPFSEPDAVTHLIADRTDAKIVEELATRLDPDVIIDCAAFYPRDVEVAVGSSPEPVFVEMSAGEFVEVGELFFLTPPDEMTESVFMCGE